MDEIVKYLSAIPNRRWWWRRLSLVPSKCQTQYFTLVSGKRQHDHNEWWTHTNFATWIPTTTNLESVMGRRVRVYFSLCSQYRSLPEVRLEKTCLQFTRWMEGGFGFYANFSGGFRCYLYKTHMTPTYFDPIKLVLWTIPKHAFETHFRHTTTQSGWFLSLITFQRAVFKLSILHYSRMWLFVVYFRKLSFDTRYFTHSFTFVTRTSPMWRKLTKTNHKYSIEMWTKNVSVCF